MQDSSDSRVYLSKGCTSNRQRLLIQRLGPSVMARRAVEFSQIIQARGKEGMLRSQMLAGQVTGESGRLDRLLILGLLVELNHSLVQENDAFLNVVRHKLLSHSLYRKIVGLLHYRRSTM